MKTVNAIARLKKHGTNYREITHYGTHYYLADINGHTIALFESRTGQVGAVIEIQADGTNGFSGMSLTAYIKYWKSQEAGTPYTGAEFPGERYYKCTNIKWDTDGQKVALPTNVLVETDPQDVADDDGHLADVLSDEFGWCVSSLDAEPLPPTETPSDYAGKGWRLTSD